MSEFLTIEEWVRWFHSKLGRAIFEVWVDTPSSWFEVEVMPATIVFRRITMPKAWELWFFEASGQGEKVMHWDVVLPGLTWFEVGPWTEVQTPSGGGWEGVSWSEMFHCMRLWLQTKALPEVWWRRRKRNLWLEVSS